MMTTTTIPSGRQLKVKEVKIVDLGSPVNFVRQIFALGGRMVTGCHFLRDYNYVIDEIKRLFKGKPKIVQLVNHGYDPEMIALTFSFLGLRQLDIQKDFITAFKPIRIPQRTIRLRQQSEKITWLVKELRQPNVDLADLVELALVVPNKEEITHFLASLDYQAHSIREKFCLTFQLADVFLELNIGPVARPWVTIEAGTAEEIFSAITQLGYQPNQIAAESEHAYYKRCGVSPTNHLVFFPALTAKQLLRKLALPDQLL